jgi:hypothetical protein
MRQLKNFAAVAMMSLMPLLLLLCLTITQVQLTSAESLLTFRSSLETHCDVSQPDINFSDLRSQTTLQSDNEEK